MLGLLQQVQQQMATLAKMGRRAALTAEELSSVPEDARTYNTIGRACVLASATAPKFEWTFSHVLTCWHARMQALPGAQGADHR